MSSLKLRVVAVGVVAGLGAAVGASIAVLGATQAELQRQLLANERDDRERTAALLAGKLEMLKASLAAVAAHTRPALLHDAAALGDFLLDKPGVAVLFDNVAAAAADGTVLARVERGALATELPRIADREYFQRVMQGDQPVVSTPLLGRASQVPLVVVAAPVLGADGRATGAIVGTLRLQSTSLFANPGGGSNDDARELVIDRDGTLLAHPDPARLLGRAADEPGLEAVFARWHESGSPIDTRASAELTAGHLVSMVGIPLSDWALVRLVPRNTALAPIAAAHRTAVLAAMVAAAASSLLAGLLAWGIARPIGRLRDRAERLCRAAESVGDEVIDAWPAEAGEIGAMSRAFRLLLEARAGQRARMQSVLVQLQAVLDNAEVGIALTRDGCFELVSRQLCQTLGRERSQLVGQSTRSMHPSDEAYEAFSARAHPAFMAQGMFDGEVQLARAGGELFWARMRGRAVVPGDRSQGTIWAVVDVTAEKDQRERLNYAASHDRLTGLANRATFEAALEEATARAAEAPFCALFIDLDRFKQVNDTGGHAAGDALLRDIAQALLGKVRKSDLVARLGGDEFAVLLPQCPPQRARGLAESMREAVEAYRLPWEGQSHGVGASIGLVAVNGGHRSAADVLRAADAACYEAKRAGRNRVALAAAEVG